MVFIGSGLFVQLWLQHCTHIREKLVTELCHYFVVDRVHTTIEMFMGALPRLAFLNVSRNIQLPSSKYFAISKKHLQPKTSSKPLSYNLTSLGQIGALNRRQQSCMHWRDYLCNCEGIIWSINCFKTQHSNN